MLPLQIGTTYLFFMGLGLDYFNSSLYTNIYIALYYKISKQRVKKKNLCNYATFACLSCTF